MATSGTYIYQLSSDDLINAAYRKLLVIGESQTANAAKLVTGRQAQNVLVAGFRSLGMPLWARKELAITLVSGQKNYTIGIGQTISQPYPVHIHEAVLNQGSTDSNIDINMMARADFNLLPETTGGTAVNATYQPFINYGVLSVWPTPDSSMASGTTATITYQAPFQYFIAGADTPDFPEEWYNAIIYGTAVLLAPENGTPLQDQQSLQKQADQYLSMALNNGTEDGSIFFGPSQSS